MRVRPNDVEELDGVLIYDGECPFCSAAATALRRLPSVGTVTWSDEAAQAFLTAQFDEVPFAVVFIDVDAEEVYIGRDGAIELCRRAGVPAVAQEIINRSYARISRAVRVGTGSSRELDQFHDTVALAEPAREELEALVEAATPAAYVVTE